MSDKEKQIAEMAKITCYVCEFGHGFNGDCDLGKDKPCCISLGAAEKLYETGYRKLEEHEWEEVAIVKQGEIVKRCYECPVCGLLCDTNAPFCPACGANMKGGNRNNRDKPKVVQEKT